METSSSSLQLYSRTSSAIPVSVLCGELSTISNKNEETTITSYIIQKAPKNNKNSNNKIAKTSNEIANDLIAKSYLNIHNNNNSNINGSLPSINNIHRRLPPISNIRRSLSPTNKMHASLPSMNNDIHLPLPPIITIHKSLSPINNIICGSLSSIDDDIQDSLSSTDDDIHGPLSPMNGIIHHDSLSPKNNIHGSISPVNNHGSVSPMVNNRIPGSISPMSQISGSLTPMNNIHAPLSPLTNIEPLSPMSDFSPLNNVSIKSEISSVQNSAYMEELPTDNVHERKLLTNGKPTCKVPKKGTGRKKPKSNNTKITSKTHKQHYAAADSNSSTPPAKSFVPCKVCGDKASGYHYGVTSCEGCKGFFRRSIQKQIEYRCLRDGKCLVIRLNRNRCQYCRFKKCLSVGMSRDSVRYGRVPKRSRERSDSESTPVPTPESPESSDSDGKHLAVYDIILMVSQAHHANCDYTEEQTRGLIRKPVPQLPSAVNSGHKAASSTVERIEMQRVWLWQQFATHVTPTVQRIVEFAKRVPGFNELSQDDQLILIKVGFFELWLGQVARLTSDTTLTFYNGTFLTKQQLGIIYDEDFVESIFHFASTFNCLALNDTELGLFCAVVLISPDRNGVTDVKAVQHHQDRLLDALKVQVGRNHASEPHVLSTVLMKLPELRSLGAKHLAHLDWFRANWCKLKLPPLFAEIFDIPKCEEDLQL